MAVINSALQTIDSYSVGIGNAFNNLTKSIEKWHEFSIVESLAELGSSLSTAGYYLAWIPYNFDRFVNFFSTTPWVEPIVTALKALDAVPLLWTLGFAGSIGNALRGIQFTFGLVQSIRFQNIFGQFAWRGCPPPDQPRTWTDETPKSRLLNPSLAPMDTAAAEAFYQAIDFDPKKEPKINCYKLVYFDPAITSRKIVREKVVLEKDGLWKIYSPTDPEWTERDPDWEEGSYTFEQILQKLGLEAANQPQVETIDRVKATERLKSQPFVLRKDKGVTVSLEQALSTVRCFSFYHAGFTGTTQYNVLLYEGKYLVYSHENEYLGFYHSQQDLFEAYGPLRELSSKESQYYLTHLNVDSSEELQCFELPFTDQGPLQRDFVVLHNSLYVVFSGLDLSFKGIYSTKRELFASYDLPKEAPKPKEDPIKLLENLACINPLLLERSLPAFMIEELTKSASQYPQTLVEKLGSDDAMVEESRIMLDHLGKLPRTDSNVDRNRVKSLLQGISSFSIQDYLKVLASRMRRGHEAALREGAKLLERMNNFSLRKADWMAICLVGSLVAIAGCIGFFVAFPLAITIALTILGIALTTTAFVYRRFVVENPTGKFHPVMSGFLPPFFNEWKKRQDEIDELLHQNLSAYSFLNSPL